MAPTILSDVVDWQAMARKEPDKHRFLPSDWRIGQSMIGDFVEASRHGERVRIEITDVGLSLITGRIAGDLAEPKNADLTKGTEVTISYRHVRLLVKTT
jgi:hypothetical protein